jgi:hypothetical protein
MSPVTSLREERVTFQGGEPERVFIPRGPVQVRHEDEARQHVGGDHVRPRHHCDAGCAAEREPRVEDQFLGDQAEHHAQQQPRGRSQGGEGGRHGDAEQREDGEVDQGIRRHQSERRGEDVLPGERAREGGRRVKRPAREGVDHEEPEGDHQAREQATDYAICQHRVQRPFHDCPSCGGFFTQYRAQPYARNARGRTRTGASWR